MKPIYVALADDEVLFRKGMELLIKNFDGIELIFEAENGKDLLEQLENQFPKPDVVLMDMKMPVLNGIETAKVLSSQYPDIKVIILSTYFSKPFVTKMLELGAAAYFPKNTLPEEIEKSIHTVVSKGFYYSDEVLEIIRENLQTKSRPSSPSFGLKLTPREQETLQLICEQYTNSEIAEKLHISTRTVDGYRTNLLQKFNCKNTAGLVALAIQQKLIKLDSSPFWG